MIGKTPVHPCAAHTETWKRKVEAVHRERPIDMHEITRHLNWIRRHLFWIRKRAEGGSGSSNLEQVLKILVEVRQQLELAVDLLDQ